MVRIPPQGPMNVPLHLLHLEDHEGDAELVRLRLLTAFGPQCTVKQVKSAAEFTAALEADAFDVGISDGAVTGIDGFSALRPAKPISRASSARWVAWGSSSMTC